MATEISDNYYNYVSASATLNWILIIGNKFPFLLCFAFILQLYLALFERGKPVRTCEQSRSFWKIFMLQDNPEFPKKEHSECCEFLAVMMCTCSCVFQGGNSCAIVFAPFPVMYWASFRSAETKDRCIWVGLQNQTWISPILSHSLPLSLHVFKGRIFFSWGCYNSLPYYYHFFS